MSSNKKKQHYIPKFQLRHFSDDKKQIGVFYINKSQFISRASIRDQGQKKFYYGKDGKLEDLLSTLETEISNTFKTITSTILTPKNGSQDHFNLMAHIVLSSLRNPVTIDTYKGMANKTNSALKKEHPDIDNPSVISEISHDEAIELSFGLFEQMIDNITDLDFKIIINKSRTPFVTSDNPIAKYNLLFESLKIKHLGTGYSTLGLMLFFPINTEIGMVFFDKESYKIANRKDKSLIISNDKEIDQLNTLQLLNSYQCVFFNNLVNENYINEINEASLKFVKANNSKVELKHLLKKDEKIEDKENKELLIMSNSISSIRLNIQGIKVRKDAKLKVKTDRAQLRPHAQKLSDIRKY